MKDLNHGNPGRVKGFVSRGEKQYYKMQAKVGDEVDELN